MTSSPSGRAATALTCLLCLGASAWGQADPAARKRFEPKGVAALAFSPDGRLLASGGLDGSLRIGDPATAKVKWRVAAHDGAYAVAFTPDGKQLVSAGADAVIRVWDVSSGKPQAVLKGHEATVTCLAFAGEVLVSGSKDKTIRFWDLAGRRQTRSVPGHGEGVLTLRVTSDDLLLSTGEKKEVLAGGHFIVTGPDKPRLWSLATGKEVRSYEIEADQVLLSYDRRFLAASGVETKLDGTTLTQTKFNDLRDAATGRKLGDIKINSCRAMAFAPDGKLLATVDSGRSLRLWEVVTGREVHRVAGWDGTALAFAPDGRRLAGGTAKGEVLFVELPPDRAKWAKKAKGADGAKLWEALAGDDSAAAFAALWTLAATPKEAVALLKARLKRPGPATSLAQMRKLIDELDSDQLTTREAATEKLRKLGAEAEIPLRAALDSGKLSPEARRRVQRLVAGLKLPFPWTGEALREARALHLLELIDTPEAHALVKTLAAGPPTLPVVQDARRILERRGKARR